MARKIDTRRVVVLGTCHLTTATCDLLNSTPIESWPVAGGRLPFGFYIYVHDERPSDCPDDLWGCICFARNQGVDLNTGRFGFDYIQFDGDADADDGLPDYSVEEA